MDIKEFILKRFKRAYIGCLDWCEYDDKTIYYSYYYKRDILIDMLLELGYKPADIRAIETDIENEYYNIH